MQKCIKCNKEKEIKFFNSGGHIVKSCKECRIKPINSEEPKICKVCKQEKKFEEFKTTKPGRIAVSCKDCRKTAIENTIENKEHGKKCTDCKGYRNLDEFIGKKGVEVNRCKGCRDIDDKQKQKPDVILKRNKRNKEKQYYKKYRIRLRTEDLEKFLEHQAKIHRLWCKKNKEHLSEYQKNNPNTRLYSIKYQAKIKDIEWKEEMTTKYCIDLIKKPCFYCNKNNYKYKDDDKVIEKFDYEYNEGDEYYDEDSDFENNQNDNINEVNDNDQDNEENDDEEYIKNDDIRINSINRLDSQGCYEVDNCVTCCKECTYIKGCLDPLTFIERCVHITKFKKNGKMINKSAWQSAKRVSYNDYKIRANNHKPKLEFKLDENKFLEICAVPCYYCNKENSNEHSNGIDRKDNSIGYIESNCVSCCKECNQMKSNLSNIKFIECCKNVFDNKNNIKISVNIPRCFNRIVKRKVEI